MGGYTRRLALLTGLLSLTAVVAVPAAEARAAGTPASGGAAGRADERPAARRGPFLVDGYAYPAVQPGRASWVKVWWSSSADICDVRVTVTGRRVRVSYPDNTQPWTSFYRTDGLKARDFDYTAFKVTAGADETRPVDLQVDVSYTRLPDGTLFSRAAGCRGPRGHRVTSARLLILPD